MQRCETLSAVAVDVFGMSAGRVDLAPQQPLAEAGVGREQRAGLVSAVPELDVVFEFHQQTSEAVVFDLTFFVAK